MSTDLTTVHLLLPELTLVVLAVWMFVGSAFRPSRSLWTGLSLAALALVALALFRQDTAIWSDGNRLQTLTSHALSGPLLVDRFGHTCRWLAVVLGALFVLTTSRASNNELSGEYLGAAMLSIVGLMLVAAAGDIVLLFLGLELISIPTYVLLFLGRRNRSSAEATVKYFFLSILASAFFLYGLSFLYGVAGSTNLEEIRNQLAAADSSPLSGFLPLALVLMFAGLGFKIAAVPFHFYAPDVYQATTNANAGLLAVVPKAAGVIALVRLTVAVSAATSDFAWQLTLIISILSMTLGNVCALWQRDLRRLLAYSSIAHAGYMLIGLTVGIAAGERAIGYNGMGAMLFYLLVYSAASLGAFATLAYLSDEREVSQLDELAGLTTRHPIAAALLAIFMFSLSGIPPLAGFWGKLGLFTSALGQAASDASNSRWFIVLTVVAAVNAAVAAAYYLRVIGVMYFGAAASDSPRSVPAGRTTKLAGLAALACGLLVIIVGIVPGRLIQTAGQAGISAQHNGPPATLSAATVPQVSTDASEKTGPTPYVTPYVRKGSDQFFQKLEPGDSQLAATPAK